jgi:hypothetical protein
MKKAVISVCAMLIILTAMRIFAEEAAPKTAAEEAKPALPVVGDFFLSHNFGPNGSSVKEVKPDKGWVITDFVGTGAVTFADGVATLGRGNDMSGITWTGPLVRMNYDITLEAKRVEGEDFFCGLTAPYREDCYSLIVGGWGGRLVGISSIDYNDAYNNETARFRDFEMNRWYRVRLRALPDRIQAWIDDEQIVDVETTDRKIDIRWEVTKSMPLGISTWCTTGAIRNVAMRALEGEAIAESESP